MRQTETPEYKRAVSQVKQSQAFRETIDLRKALPVQRGPLTYRESGVPEVAWYRGHHSGIYNAYLALREKHPRAAALLLKEFSMRPDGRRRPMSEIGEIVKWQPLVSIVRAMRILQSANLKALTAGEGRGHTTREMAAILDRELGFTNLYEALANLECQSCGYDIGSDPGDPAYRCETCDESRAALAKARGEASTQLPNSGGDDAATD